MMEGTGLTAFAENFPERFFDVGIAEPHAATFSAGLATQGYVPVVAIYSTFLQRGIDAIIHDIALQKLPVVFAIDRAGIVGADGPTHHGMFDLAYLGMIPGLKVCSPSCLSDLEFLLAEAVRSRKPFAIRYPRGSGPESLDVPFGGDRIRRHRMSQKPQLITVALGPTVSRVLRAANEVDPKTEKIAVLSTVDAKPFPAALVKFLDEHRNVPVMTVEDGILHGGFGQTLLAAAQPRSANFITCGYGDHFIPHGSPADLEEEEGLSQNALKKRMSELLA
jgi:1-deoxy-D-xylulose-5-phosphate synthase